MRHPRLVVVALLALFAAAPLLAYTVVMRDGSRLVAKEKYRVVGDKAIITLQNGTQTSIAVSEIDVARTENANRANLGTAVLLEDGKPADYTGAPPPERKPSLADIASSRGAATMRETPSPRPERTVISSAGHADLRTIPHAAFPSHDLSGELQQLFRGGGIQEIALYRGTRADRPFVEVTTNSEAAIFRTLEVAATALLQIRERYPRKVEALEILMLTANRDRAGQFVMTPDLASELAGKRVEASAFFVQHVQF
jgi:hypothetical protein